MTTFTSAVSLSVFHNIPKALPNGILFNSRLTDLQFANHLGFKISKFICHLIQI